MVLKCEWDHVDVDKVPGQVHADLHTPSALVTVFRFFVVVS
jgi:hypothetical protein